METIKVSELVKALEVIGRVYRNKNGSKPADAVLKLIQQLSGSGEVTLDEWVKTKESKAALPKKSSKAQPNPDFDAIANVKTKLAQARDQLALRDEISGVKLKAEELRVLAKELTGKAGRSGKAAKELIETHFSDQLLLHERVDSVKRQFS